MAMWSYWLMASVAAFVVEMFLGTVYLLVLSAALAGAGFAALLFGAGGGVCALVAALLSAVGTVYVHRLRRLAPKPASAAEDLDIGGIVHVEQELPGGTWRVFYRGTVWEARASGGIVQGGSARICGKDGIVLLVEAA